MKKAIYEKKKTLKKIKKMRLGSFKNEIRKKLKMSERVRCTFEGGYQK